MGRPAGHFQAGSAFSKLVLLLGVAISAGASIGAGALLEARNAEKSVARFQELTDRAADQLRRRFQIFEYGLRGARGAIIAVGEDSISRAKFRAYSETRDLATEFVGSRGFGFARLVKADAASSFVEQARRDGSPAFSIREANQNPGDRFVIQYLEPEPLNQEAIGFDIASEPNRRDAALSAIDSGKATLTAPVTLARATAKKGRGLLLLLPVYRPGEPIDTAERRRSAAVGFTFMPLVIDEVLANFDQVENEFALTLRDDSDAHAPPFYASSSAGQEAAGGLRRRIPLEIYGRHWVIEALALSPFVDGLNLPSPPLVVSAVLTAGMLLTGFLQFGLAARSRRRQAQLAQSRLAAIVNGSNDAIIGATLGGEITDWNPAAERLFGYRADEAIGRCLTGFIVPQGRTAERDDAIDRLLKSNSGTSLVTQRLTRHGATLDMIVSFSLIRSERDEVVGIGSIARDISAQVAAQRQIEALNESLERQIAERTSELNAIINANPNTIAYWDTDLRCRFANQAHVKWFGREPQTMIGETVMSFLGDELFARNEALIRAALAGEPQNFERALTKPNGRTRHVWANYVPHFGEAGQVLGFFALVTDVTPIKEAEQRIEQSEARYRLLAENGTDMVFQLDRDLVRQYVSPACQHILGYEDRELIGSKPRNQIHPEDLPAVERAYHGLLSGEDEHGSVVNRIRHRDGRWVWVEATLRSLKDPRTGEVSGILGALRDISARKAIESELVQAKDDAYAASALQNAILRHAAYAVVATDPSGLITIFNPAAERLLGYYAREVVGKATPILFHDPAELEVRAAELSAQTGRPIKPGLNVLGSQAAGDRPHVKRWTYIKKSGRAVPVRLSLSELRTQDGQQLGFVGIAMDLTDQLAHDAELTAAKDAAEAAGRAKADFLASMSHELRTPLNSIIGFSRLVLASQDIRGSSIERQVHLIHAASRTLLSIVNDILDVTKLEANRLDLDPRPFSPAALLRSTAELVQAEARAKGIELRVDVAPQVPAAALGDDSRLRQILLNLLANALKFTPRGSVTVRAVNDSGDPSRARLRVSVRDTGIGIPEAARPRIFQRFSQVDSSTSRTYGGTGLGLSICKSLVELMGGSIGFDSREGEGTTFWFAVDLPVVDHELSTAEIGIAGAAEETDAPADILLAEDNALNQELATSIIGAWGHRIDVVSNGAEAIEAVRRKSYDIVLMDVHMPVMDGVEATTRIRALGGVYQTLPIVAMTAAVLANQVENFKRAGMTDHIGKPFDPRELRLLINRLAGAGASARLDRTIVASPPLAPEQPITSQAELASQPELARQPEEVLKEDVFSGLAEMIGPDKAADLARKFAADLDHRFADPADRKLLRSDAHIIASSAGAIGFIELSEAARRLEQACDRAEDPADHLHDLLARRRRVGEFIGRRFGP
jgi:PAS domain S-box-containing protein